ncbi:MAG: YtxH domain-containing protein [Candidatus Aminicenantes bacterium]|nr:YtxH domain-containing protein [Candidatus Aminicenantes bacterium]MCK4760407.1 YtxH domain-containing protein [Candidatus Aminicenantes bacterium]
MNILIGIGIGGGIGFLFHKFIGCRTGHCPITRSPWTSVLYGMLIGLLLTLR